MGKDSVNCRTVLWYLTFVGMAVNYMIRININLTIVTMVKPKTNAGSMHLTECAAKNGLSESQYNDMENETLFDDNSMIKSLGNSYNEKLFPNGYETKDISIERKLLRYLGITFDENGFPWNEYQQGLALGSFYWLHWLTQVPGGILSRRYGPKLIYGLSNFISSLLCCFMPIASYLSLDILIYLRVVQGLITGLAWPAMHTMTANWIPPNERSKFVSAYLGSSFGVFINYPLFGFIISLSCWENVYHFCGVFGTLWFIAWCYMVYDTPTQHPRISEEERKHIQSSLGDTVHKKNYPTPWLEILKSRAVWMIIVAQWGGIWGLFTLMTQAPTYFKYIHGWDIRISGFLSGLPHLMRIMFAILFSSVGDYLLRNEKMSRTNLRKLGTAFSTIVIGMFVLGLAYSGCNSTAAIVFLTLAVGVHGAVSTGPLAAIVDIAPNFAGITLGLTGMIGVIPGFVSPIIVGLLTLNNQTAKQWEIVYLITAGMLIVPGIIYCLFGTATLQDWNSPSKDKILELESSIDKDSKSDQSSTQKCIENDSLHISKDLEKTPLENNNENKIPEIQEIVPLLTDTFNSKYDESDDTEYLKTHLSTIEELVENEVTKSAKAEPESAQNDTFTNKLAELDTKTAVSEMISEDKPEDQNENKIHTSEEPTGTSVKVPFVLIEEVSNDLQREEK